MNGPLPAEEKFRKNIETLVAYSHVFSECVICNTKVKFKVKLFLINKLIAINCSRDIKY